MMPAFHYVLRYRLIIRHANGEILVKEEEEVFKNAQPIIARKQAFYNYQNYLDVICGKNNISNENALKQFNSGKIAAFNLPPETTNEDIVRTGIAIYMIIDKPVKLSELHQSELFDLFGDSLVTSNELYIHGIGHAATYQYSPAHILSELASERKYYNYYGYETKGEEVEIIFCDQDEWNEGYLGEGNWKDGYFEPNSYTILATPFDWTKFSEPYWWGKPKPGATFPISQPIIDPQVYSTYPVSKLKEILSKGENNTVEFKPSLLHNFNTNQPGIGVKYFIAKAICAFANSNGGLLIIGVDDDGAVQGLKFDFQHAGKKNPRDFFNLEFDQMLSRFFPVVIRSIVTTEFVTIDDKMIYVVAVAPMKRKSVFMKGKEGKEFYVRGEASSRRIGDIEDIVDYCIERFGNPQPPHFFV